MRALFAVTFEIVTPESAKHGDAAERGFISQNSTLRDAVADFHATRTAQCDGVAAIECDSSRGRPQWVTIVNGAEYQTGANESRSLHIPPAVSRSSARRIAQLLGAHL